MDRKWAGFILTATLTQSVFLNLNEYCLHESRDKLQEVKTFIKTNVSFFKKKNCTYSCSFDTSGFDPVFQTIYEMIYE